MAQEIKTAVREGKAYNFPFGISAEGQAAVWIEPQEPDSVKMQPYKIFWEGTNMKASRGGELNEVVTTFRIDFYDNAGNVIASYSREISEKTNQSDLTKYKYAMYPLLGPATINLFFIGGDGPNSGFLGSEYPPFLNGQFVPDEQQPEGATTAPPTWAYNAENQDDFTGDATE